MNPLDYIIKKANGIVESGKKSLFKEEIGQSKIPVLPKNIYATPVNSGYKSPTNLSYTQPKPFNAIDTVVQKTGGLISKNYIQSPLMQQAKLAGDEVVNLIRKPLTDAFNKIQTSVTGLEKSLIRPDYVPGQKLDFTDASNVTLRAIANYSPQGFTTQAIYNGLGSLYKATTGNDLPKITVPALGGRGDILESKTSQEYYNDQIASGSTPNKAFWDTTVKTVMDMTILVPMLRQFSKNVVTKTNPSSLINAEKTTITKETMRDYLTGRKTPEDLNLPIELRQSIADTLKSGTRADKVKMLGGIDVLEVKPSALGKILGVSEAEANQMLKTTFGGPIRETPIGELPGTAIVGTPQPAFGLSVRPVKKVGYGDTTKVTKADEIVDTLMQYDTKPLKVDGKMQFDSRSLDIEKLQDKLKAGNELTIDELKQAENLLGDAGAIGKTLDLNTSVMPKTASEQVVTPKPNNLIEEANKYPTKEEFVKAQGISAYHGTSEKFTNFDLSKIGKSTDSGMYGKGFYFSNNLSEAKTYATRNGKTGEVKSVQLDIKNPYIINSKSDIPKIDIPNKTIADLKNSPENYSQAFTNYLKNKGYDGVIDNLSKNKQYVVFNPEQIKTKSQLEDIWNKAQQKQVSPIETITKTTREKLSGYLKSENPKIRSEANDILMEYNKASANDKPGIAESMLKYMDDYVKNIDDNKTAFKLKDEDKSLLAVHNINSQKLSFADKTGGIANPSIGIVDVNKQELKGFGDISLITDSSMIEPNKMSKGQTFGADIYSPRYPYVKTILTSKMKDKIEKDLSKYEDIVGEKVSSRLDFDELERSLENNALFKMKWLESKGVTVKPIDGKVNRYAVNQALTDYVEGNTTLQNEYISYLQDYIDSLGAEKKFFAGYTNTGTPRYIPATVENASKLMNKEDLQGGESMFYGLGSIRAGSIKKFKNIGEIKKAKNRILKTEDFEKIRSGFETKFNEIQDDVSKYATKISSNPFSQRDYESKDIGSYISTGKLSDTIKNIPQKLKDKIDLFASELASIIYYYDPKIEGDRLNKLRELSKKTQTAFKLSPEQQIVFDKTKDEIQARLNKIFGRDIPLQTIIDPEMMSNPNALGEVSGGIIKLLEENGSLSEVVANHEGWHWFKRSLSKEKRTQITKLENEFSLLPENKAKIDKLIKDGYTKEEVAEELMGDHFAEYTRTGKTFSEKIKLFFDRLWNTLKTLFSKKGEVLREFRNVRQTLKNQARPEQVSLKPAYKQVSPIDTLIAQGKIKLKSKDGRDIYQYKKGNEWVNARDEDSAIKAVTPKPKTTTELSPELQKKQVELELRKEVIENSRLNFDNEIVVTKKGEKKAISPLASIMDIKEGGIRELGDTTGKVSKRIEDLMGKAGYEDPTKFKEDLERFVEAKKSLKEDEKILRQQIAMEKGKKELAKPEPILAPKKDIPQFEGEQGEVKSLELVARERESLLDGEVDVPGVSLNKIISNTVTPVEKKVGIIDTFLRTPDRVMKSIGFGEEAKELRSSMDEYWKELPKNIEKINEWRKSLPTESNERIFKFLDGQAITLNAQENKVADEVRVWLKDWAKRLKLPADRQITDYITRIFDQDSAKEFNEELAKLIADKIPGSVYNPFLLKRLGAKGYKQDTWLALSAYTKRATRKVHMDPVLAKIKEKTGGSLDVSNIEKTQFKYIQNYVNNINLRPTDLDEAIDTSFKKIFRYKLGGRPVNRATRILRQATFRGMLGLNPGSALRNLSQGINTYATLGEKYTAIGYASLLKKGAMKELEEQGVLNAGFIQDKVLSATGKAIEKVDKVLFAFFDAAEKINRGSAYFGAKSKALADGKTEVEAIEYAKEIVRKTQFSFDVIDTPVGLSSDIMKTMFQFQTFTTKQIEFLTEMARDKNFVGLLRYAIAGLLFVATIGKAFNMEPKELLPIYRFQVPPSMKAPFEIAKALFDAPDKYGQDRDITTKASDIGKSLIGYIPAGTQAKKTIGGIQAVKEGGSYTKDGKLQYEQGESLASKIQSILFGKYAQENAQKYFDKIEINKEEKAKIQPIYDEVKKLDEAGRGEEAQAIVDDLSDADYEVYKKIKTTEKTKKTLEGKKKMLPIYSDIQKMGDEEAQKALDSLSDEEYEYYKAIKKDRKELEKAKEGEKPEFGEAQTDENIIKTVWTYAKAIGVDPVTAFNRVFTGQKIRYVSNGVIVVERMSLQTSQAVKEAQGGANPTMKLDHTIPLQLGGSNDKDNLKLVPTDLWATYTPVENAIGLAVRGNKISKKEAQELIKGFKNGDLTSEDVYLKLK